MPDARISLQLEAGRSLKVPVEKKKKRGINNDSANGTHTPAGSNGTKFRGIHVRWMNAKA